jgi:hypothetical protein
LDKNYIQIALNMWTHESADTSTRGETKRGIFFLPSTIPNEFYNNPSLNYLHGNLGAQWFCMNHHGKIAKHSNQNICQKHQV